MKYDIHLLPTGYYLTVQYVNIKWFKGKQITMWLLLGLDNSLV